MISGRINKVWLNGVFKGEKPILVEFFANWCSHCQKMQPVLDILEKRNCDKLAVERYDIDEPQNEKLLEYYKVQSVPTFLLFRDGDQVWRQSGEMSPEQLDEVVKRYK